MHTARIRLPDGLIQRNEKFSWNTTTDGCVVSSAFVDLSGPDVTHCHGGAGRQRS
jgi:3-deoxy-D-arabino-heptulosonate 7-phosphate (DAHP) synthase class II